MHRPSPAGVAPDDNMIKQIRSKVQEKIDAVGSATLKSMGVTFATKCDENAGIDVDANQVAYLWKAGAKMAAFAAIMLLAACVVGFAASKVGAAVGRDLREKTFSKVVGFSNAEINKFSTASLITRSTNDIQQIQMVTTMMLRMVLYAPIVGIGGIIKVAQTKSGMEGDCHCGCCHHGFYFHTGWHCYAKVQDYAESCRQGKPCFS